MTIQEIEEKYGAEHGKFDLIENKLSQRPDLHAFILLDSIIPDDTDIVSSTGHDEFWLGIDVDELLKKASDDQILELIRCGVSFDEDGLSMYT